MAQRLNLGTFRSNLATMLLLSAEVIYEMGLQHEVGGLDQQKII